MQNSTRQKIGANRGCRCRTAQIRYCRVAAAFLAASNVAPTQIGAIASAATPAGDDGLTWHGVMLYGLVDLGLQYDTHGAPFSDYFPAGSADIVQKNSNRSVTGVTPNNLGQSRVGLRGEEPLGAADLSGVFTLESFFNPQSGDIGDGPKSLTLNNGKSLPSQGTNLDTSVAGQAFQISYVGLSSPLYGTLTFGRQNSVLADGVSKYDPQSASQAFSVIGLSGTAAGGGDTEDRRLDSSVKYVGGVEPLHYSVQYKFSNANARTYAGSGSGAAYTAVEAALGMNCAGASVDFYYARIKDAVSSAALSATQLAGLPTMGYSASNSLAGTISDNTTYGVMGLFRFRSGSVLAGYEHITFSDPSIALRPGFDDIGGYVLAYVNNTAYANADKVLQVYWMGAKVALANHLNGVVAYYGYKQDSYATGKYAGCSSAINAACSGYLNAVSFSVDYRLSRRFDTYVGAMWSSVSHGLANGYLETSNINPTIGARYSF